MEIKEIAASETWPIRHKVMWPSKPLEFVVLPNDEEGLHFGLYEKEILVSVISLFIDGQDGQFRKFATDIFFQRCGYGTILLNYLIKESQRLNLKILQCNARTTAIEFYQRFGMKITSEVFRKNGKDYVMMELDFEQ
jgi:ribosomal protein S18 acetylase RimI-like enzyme